MKKANSNWGFSILIVLTVLSVCNLGSAQTESIIAPGEKVQLLSADFKFTEGPTCDKEGNVFFMTNQTTG
jgi:gluconolactonase